MLSPSSAVDSVLIASNYVIASTVETGIGKKIGFEIMRRD
jgi:hypothetical protein